MFTFGGGGVWYGQPGETIRERSAFCVEAIDTGGAGDSFRAGVAYGLLQGWEDSKTIDFESAVAGIVCSRYPGVMNSPGYDAAVDFINSHEHR